MFRVRILIFIILLAVVALWEPLTSSAIEDAGSVPDRFALKTKLGTQVDLNLRFTKGDGTTVALRELFKEGRPLILLPVYYECPRLCGMLLQGVSELLNQLNLPLGDDYRVVAISFNPKEGPDLALTRQQEFRGKLHDLPQSGRAAGWDFMVGSPEPVKTLLNQIGFPYEEDKGEFVHSAVLMILTPNGQISQYFTGINFSARDVRLALVEASQGKIGNLIDHALLFCFRFDPLKGKYTWAAFNLMRAGGALTLLGLGALIVLLRLRERRALLAKLNAGMN